MPYWDVVDLPDELGALHDDVLAVGIPATGAAPISACGTFLEVTAQPAGSVGRLEE
ncbi:MAG: hypothetical protein ACR2M5_05600 [Nakamurella sp.]